MSVLMIIEGPSGVQFEARKFRGREIQKVADRIEEGGDMSESAMCTLLAASWVRTVNVGPYVDLSLDVVPNFYHDVLKADIPGLLLSLRVGSFRRGAEYSFDVRCSDPQCGEPINWHTNIAKHVLTRVRPPSAAAIAYIENKRPIDIKIPDGPTLGLRLTTHSDEEPVRKFLEQQRKRRKRVSKQVMLADRIASQLMTVDGVPMKSIAHRLEYTSDMTMDDLYDVRDAIDAHECEIDTSITVKCHECKWEFDAQLPFGQQFLDPTSGSRRERLFGQRETEQNESESNSSPNNTETP